MIPLSAYELTELHDSVIERMDEALMPALSRANRTGELPRLLELLGMGSLLGNDDYLDLKPTKIAVLSDSQVKEEKLRSIARKRGFDSKNFDFALDYNELKHYDFGKFRNSMSYRAVLVGPMPHSTPGKFDSSSAVAKMQANPDIYPPVIELRDSNGLKITNNSFGHALEELRGY